MDALHQPNGCLLFGNDSFSVMISFEQPVYSTSITTSLVGTCFVYSHRGDEGSDEPFSMRRQIAGP